MVNFYRDTLELYKIDLEVKGKVKVQGKVTERWLQIFSRSITCGDKVTRTIEKKVGITKTQREDLESLVKGSVGIEGIASIESELKAKIGYEISLETVVNEKEEKEFEAPKCGRRTLIVYQLIREYDLTITEKRFFSFSQGVSKIHLTEYTDNYYDESLTTFNDSNCGCKNQPDDSDDGLFSILLNSKYNMLSAYKELKEKILVKNLNLELSEQDLGKLLLGKLQVNSSVIPDYIRFLADVKEDYCTLSINTKGNVAFKYEEKMFFNRTFVEQMNLPIGTIRAGALPQVYPGFDPISGYGVYTGTPGIIVTGPAPDNPFSLGQGLRRFRQSGEQEEGVYSTE